MKIIWLVLLLPLTALALINGKPLKGYPDLVRLEFNHGDGICTGFFVSPTLIVTAAHCLFSWRDGAPAKLTAIKLEGGKVLELPVSAQMPHPEYLSGRSAHDLAVVKVAEHAQFAGNYALSLDPPEKWGEVIFHGTGKIDMSTAASGRSQFRARFLRLGPYLCSFGPSVATEIAAGSVAPNDSGGPMLDVVTGKVVGIATKSTVGAYYGRFVPAVSVGISLRDEQNWKFLSEFNRIGNLGPAK